MLAPGARTEGLAPCPQDAVRNGHGAHGWPRQVHAVKSLLTTSSGKVRRMELRALGNDAVKAMSGS